MKGLIPIKEQSGEQIILPFMTGHDKNLSTKNI